MAESPAFPDGESVTKVGGLAGVPGFPTRLLIVSVTFVPEPSSKGKSIKALAPEAAVAKEKEATAIVSTLVCYFKKISHLNIDEALL